MRAATASVMVALTTAASMGCAPSPARHADGERGASTGGDMPANRVAPAAPTRLPGRAVVVIAEVGHLGAVARPGALGGATGSSDSGARPAARRRIDVSLRSADFHNALRLFADIGGFNLVIEDTVGGIVNLELEAVDPFDTLVMVAESKGAAVSVRGSTVIVTGASSGP